MKTAYLLFLKEIFGKYLIEFKNSQDNELNRDSSIQTSSDNSLSETSWNASDEESKDIMPFEDISPSKRINKEKLTRKSTYLLRREELLNNLYSDIDFSSMALGKIL